MYPITKYHEMYYYNQLSGFYLENSFWGRNRECKFIFGGKLGRLGGIFVISTMTIFKIFGASATNPDNYYILGTGSVYIGILTEVSL